MKIQKLLFRITFFLLISISYIGSTYGSFTTENLVVGVWETKNSNEFNVNYDVDNLNEDQINDNSGICPFINIMYQASVLQKYTVIYNSPWIVWQPPKI